jgi:hypothetical protein
MKVDFAAKQREFVAYIRDPENNPPPTDVKLPRVAMYRELMFNNIDNFLSSNFPVLRQLLDEARWFALVQDFFANHTSTSPYFSEIPEEFLAYLQNERDNPDDLPFMLELAHYEWVEMAVSIAKEEQAAYVPNREDLLARPVRLSPLAWPLAYQYPVHKIAPTFQPAEPPAQPTFLVVYRNQDDDVLFLEITAMTYRLLEMLQEQEALLAADCLRQIATESQHPQPEQMLEAGLQILEELAAKAIVVI